MLENSQLPPENVNQTVSEAREAIQESEPTPETPPDGIVLDEYDRRQREDWDWESPAAR